MIFTRISFCFFVLKGTDRAIRSQKKKILLPANLKEETEDAQVFATWCLTTTGKVMQRLDDLDDLEEETL